MYKISPKQWDKKTHYFKIHVKFLRNQKERQGNHLKNKAYFISTKENPKTNKESATCEKELVERERER